MEGYPEVKEASANQDMQANPNTQREAALETELKNTKAQMEELRANFMDKETKLQNISEEFAMKLKKLGAELAELKASMLAKETELHSATEQNELLKMEIEKREMERDKVVNDEYIALAEATRVELLKMEIEKREMERDKVNDESIALAEATRAAEAEALMKVGYLTEEAHKSSRREARVTEQLDATQAASTELRRLKRVKVQSDQ